MNQEYIENWLAHLLKLPDGNITVVQTVRNAIMASSVLASAALVAIMGVLAVAALHAKLTVLASMFCLLVSGFCSIRSIWLFASLSFAMQFKDHAISNSAKNLALALAHIRIAAVFLFLGLGVAALGLLYKPL